MHETEPQVVADFLRFFGCGRAPCPNGPDRLIGNDDTKVVLYPFEGSQKLPLNDSKGISGVPFIGRLADADVGTKSVGKGSLDLLIDGLIGLAEHLSALAVPDDDGRGADIFEHLGRDFSREGALLLEVAVLSPHCDAFYRCSIGNIEEGWENSHLAAGFRQRSRDDAGGGAVHFPVSCNDFAAFNHFISFL
ncbi:hypothetical protein SDC9_128351 [bioreactor metagenome]|uniref:Uncharacterized protein n=1 Tax=bioreactor metagenome TaxID=1076179 RepID=A0A645CWL1_9ZZZZ